MVEAEGQHSPDNPELKHSIEARVHEQIGQIENLAVAIGGEGSSVEDVFPEPPEVRQDAPRPEWTEEQIAAAREVAHGFGFGAEQDVSTDTHAAAVILEGGLAWKLAAEAAALNNEDPGTVIFAGSPHRVLREDEHEFVRDRLGGTLKDGATEYDLAKFFANSFVGGREERDLGFGYQVAKDNNTVEGDTGQLLQVGELEGQDVLLLRVDRENYTDEEGNMKYNQPDSAALMRFVGDVMTRCGDEETPVGLITSNTYASRTPDATRAGLKNGRLFAVGMYGRRTLAGVKGTEMTNDSPLEQLPGDLWMLHYKLQALKSELQS